MTQYNVEFPNADDMHARLTRLLIEQKVDFQSVVTTQVGDKTMIQFLAPKDDTLRVRFKELGVSVRESLVLRLQMPRNPRELHKLAQSLAARHINILSLYSVVDGDNMRIVLAVDHPSDAAALIAKLGYKPDVSIPAQDRLL
jgi:hypothetical protein